MGEPDYIQPELFSLEALSLPEESPGEVGETPEEESPMEMGETLEESPGEMGAELPEEIVAEVSAELLDAASLGTVLEMLAVIESPDELALLETLTEAQQQQVWDGLPDRLRSRLQQFNLPVEEVPPDRTEEPPLQPGDRAVLKAKPNLTKAELITVFEVVKIQEGWVQVKAPGMGLRRYGADWLVRYAKP